MDKAIWLVLAVAMAAAALAPPQADAAISCDTVVGHLTPCFSFVVAGGPVPPSNCCEGIKSLYNEATAAGDRQAVCSCLKNVANSASPAMVANAATLPSKCGVNIPYKISPSTDCSTVH